MEGVGLLIKLVGGLGVTGLEGEIAETDAGERGHFAIGLGRDDLPIEGLRFFGISRGVVDICHREKSLRIAGMVFELAHETLQRGARVFGFPLVDLQIGFGKKGVARRDRARKVNENAIKGSDFALGNGTGVGGGGLEVFLLFHLGSNKNAAEDDRTDGDGGENLGAVPVDRIDNTRRFARGERVEVRRFLGVGGLLGCFCHGLEG